MSYNVESDVEFDEGVDGFMVRVNTSHEGNTVGMDYKIELGEREDGLYGLKGISLEESFISDESYFDDPLSPKLNNQSAEEYFADNNIDINEVNKTAEKHIQDKVNPNDFTFKEIKEDLEKGVKDFFKEMEGESAGTFRTKKFKERTLNSLSDSDKISTVMFDVKNSGDLKGVFNKEFNQSKKVAVKKEESKSFSM